MAMPSNSYRMQRCSTRACTLYPQMSKMSLTIHWQESGEGLHLQVEILYLISIFLHQEEGWYLAAGTGLSMLEWDHCEESIPNSTNLWAGGSTQGCKGLHKAGYMLGVQQHSNQDWRWVEGCVCDKSQSLWTKCHVLWSFWILPSHSPHAWMTSSWISLLRANWLSTSMTS